MAAWPQRVLAHKENLAEGPCHFCDPQGSREKKAGPSYKSWFNDMGRVT